MNEEIDPKKVVYIGIGEDSDPMPDIPKTTRFWITAASCPQCGSPGRWLLPMTDRLLLRCVECSHGTDGGLEARHFPEVTFVYWCRFSLFPSDKVELSPSERRQIEEAIRQMSGGENMETPYYAMIIRSGLCLHAYECLAEKCPYKAGIPSDCKSLS